MAVQDKFTRASNMVLSAAAVLAIIWAGISLPNEQKKQAAQLADHERRIQVVERQPAVVETEIRALREQMQLLQGDVRRLQETQLEMYRLLRNGR